MVLVRISVSREKWDRHAKSEKRREEEREERRLLVSEANYRQCSFSNDLLSERFELFLNGEL